MFNGIVFKKSNTEPGAFTLKFQVPHKHKDKDREGLDCSLFFDAPILKMYGVSTAEELPSAVWFEKLRDAFLSLALVIEQEGLDRNA